MFLTDQEIHDLTGRQQKARQVAWLRRYGWRFALRDDGRPRVARAYFDKRMAGADWQLRDLRPKAGTDLNDNMAANRLLGHSAMSTTDGYIRRVAGRDATPPMREIAEVPIELQKSRRNAS